MLTVGHRIFTSDFTSTPFAVSGHMICSACLLIIDKVTVHVIEAPLFVLFFQLMGTSLVVQVAHALGCIQCDALEKKKILSFLPVALIFLSTIFLNI